MGQSDDKNDLTEGAKATASARFWSRPAVWISLTLFCIILWGSAFPAVKSGYKLFQIDTNAPNAVPTLLLFAGCRFLLAGIMAVVVTSILDRSRPFPRPGTWGDVALLSVFQTILQYSLFFISLSRTTGATGSILSSTSAFFSVLMAGLFYRNDRMDRFKTLGCILGFGGVLVLNLFGGDSRLGFRLDGEGLMLFSSIASAVGAVISKKMTARNNPRILSGWQFILGGSFLIIAGLASGGRLDPVGPSAWVLLIYLGALSATAFSLWTTMLKYHEVSKLSIFKTLIPVFGTVGSGLILGEDIFRFRYIGALVLVVLGILVLNKGKQVLGKKSAEGPPDR